MHLFSLQNNYGYQYPMMNGYDGSANTGTQATQFVRPTNRLPPAAAPGSAAAAARMNPAGTSSPKPYSVPTLSPISDANDSDVSKLNIIAPDTTLDVSSILARTTTSSTSLDQQVEIAGISLPQPAQGQVDPGNSNDNFANGPLDIPLPPPQHDAVGVQNNGEQAMANEQVAPDQAAVNDQQDQGNIEAPPTYPDNAARLPYISHPRRISLAYKYFPFETRADGPVRDVSEARGSDEDREARPSEIAHNSFPMSNYILRSWQTRGKAFQDVLQKAMVMDPDAEPAEDSANPGTDDSKKQDKFLLYSEKFGSILKNKPEKQQQNFYYHTPKFGDYVQADLDITDLAKPEPKDANNQPKKDDRKLTWKPELHLTADEIRNIQLASAYSLHAESHASAYLRASRCAINEVLTTLPPDQQAENISKLKDVKYMLQGAVYAVEQNVSNAIYVHSGLTAHMRADFLSAQGDFLPIHVKQKLLHEHFGGSGLFNSAISKYVDEITRHNTKQGQKNLENAVNQALQPNSGSQSRGYLGMPRIPLKQHQSNNQYQAQQHQGKNFHKKKPFQKSFKPKQHQQPSNRGGHQKGASGGRGKQRN